MTAPPLVMFLICASELCFKLSQAPHRVTLFLEKPASPYLDKLVETALPNKT